MYSANKFYDIIQVDAKDNIKYKPALDELTAFYKKSTREKPLERKTAKDGLGASN